MDDHLAMVFLVLQDEKQAGLRNGTMYLLGLAVDFHVIKLCKCNLPYIFPISSTVVSCVQTKIKFSLPKIQSAASLRGRVFQCE